MGSILDRVLLGIAGSSMVSVPPILNWWHANVSQVQEVQLTQFGAFAILVIGWFLGFYFTVREPETHLLGYFMKSAGLPGSVIAFGHGLQLVQ